MNGGNFMTTYKSRTEVPINEKWNLADLYTDLNKWEEDLAKIEIMVGKLKEFDGTIHDGKSLYQYLKQSEELSFLFNRVYAYCMLKVDEDTRNTSSQSLLDRARSLSVKVSSATSFFMPYLLSLDEETLKSYISEEEGLDYFAEDLFDSFRYKAHVLSKEQESILSQLGEALSAPSNTFGMINNADIKFGDIVADNGEKIELTRGMYSKIIEDEDRNKRREAYKAYYKPYVSAKNTIASTLSAAIKTNATMARIRNYPSALEKALFGDNVPKDVYTNLILSTKKNIAPLHRYTNIRKEKLQLDELRQYDLSVPLVKGVKKEIPYEDAFKLMLKGLEPLGSEYLNILQEFKNSRYIDVRETPGRGLGLIT